MNKHTKGPWEADFTWVNPGNNHHVLHVHKGAEIIAQLWLTDVYDGTFKMRQKATEANARLVAAAPLLLKACDEADVAFATINISDHELTPQARACLRDAWALVNHALSLAKGIADAFAEANPDVSRAAIAKAGY